MAKIVVKTEMQQDFFSAERKFTSWHERAREKLYPCQVSRQEKGYVSLRFGDISYRFTHSIAEDIARCIFDADLVTVGNLKGYIPKPATRESAFDQWYKRDMDGVWSYFGEGGFSVHRSEGELSFMEFLTDDADTPVNVGIYTAAVGGVMLVLESASYLFSMLDAVWLSNALMEAVGEEPLELQET